MRLDLERGGHEAAAITFYGLVLLAFGLLVALTGFVSYFVPLYDTCKSAWDNLLLRLSSPAVLLPSGVAGSVVIMAGLTLVRQWRATQRLLNTLALYRVPAPPRLTRIAREVGLAGRIDCVSGIVVAPFCYGFVQPRVCIPIVLLDMLDDSELRAMLRHEGYHAQSLDPLKIWLSRALARGLYFLPLAGDLRDSYMAAKEVAADETTVGRDKLPLASALVKILSVGGSGFEPATRALGSAEVPAEGVGHVPIAGLINVTRAPSNETEERVRRLIDGRPAQLKLPSFTSVVVSVIIVAVIFVASYTNLGAASVVPVRQECVPVDGPNRAAIGLAIERSAALPEAEVVPVVPAEAEVGRVFAGAVSAYAPANGMLQRDVTAGRSDCELLTRNCLKASPSPSQSVVGAIMGFDSPSR